MRERGWEFEICSTMKSTGEREWSVKLYYEYEKRASEYGELTRTICVASLAALKAIESEGK